MGVHNQWVRSVPPYSIDLHEIRLDLHYIIFSIMYILFLLVYFWVGVCGGWGKGGGNLYSPAVIGSMMRISAAAVAF
jgi:hypothetical protein